MLENIPKIRFKGFTDAWEQRKLGDIGSTFTGLSGKTKEDFGHGDAKFVTYMNVFSNPIGNLEKTEPIEIDNKQNEVKYGDIFFTTSSETPEEVGMSSVWLENKANVYLNSFCFGYRPLEKNNPYYMAYMLRANNFRSKMILLAQGISRYNVSKNAAMDIEIQMPKNKEQESIGKLFYEIDNLISLHQSKYDTLLKVKKSMLKKMFPKNNSLEPEIRFKEFDQVWRQRKLGDECIELIAGGDIDKSRVHEHGKYPIYANAITNEGLVGYYNDSYRVKAPAVTITGRGEIGYAKARNIDFTPVVRLISLRTIHNNIFLANAINQIRVVSESTGVPQLTVPQVEKYEMMFPLEISEENKLGELFNEIDNLITLYQSKCNKLIEIKKSMLEKMFI